MTALDARDALNLSQIQRDLLYALVVLGAAGEFLPLRKLGEATYVRERIGVKQVEPTVRTTVRRLQEKGLVVVGHEVGGQHGLLVRVDATQAGDEVMAALIARRPRFPRVASILEAERWMLSRERTVIDARLEEIERELAGLVPDAPAGSSPNAAKRRRKQR